MQFWREAFIFLIVPIPYYDFIITEEVLNLDKNSYVTVYYLFSDFILASMFLRFIFIIRAVFNYTIFMDIYSKKLCKTYGFTANMKFALRSLLNSSPGTTVFVMMLVSVFMLAY